MGATPRAAIPIPRPFSTPFARIAHGRYLLNVASRELDGSSLSFSARSGCHLCLCELSDADEVCFRYGSLIGFSSRVTLQTILNLQVGSLLAFGGVFFNAARGPGAMLFEADGAAVAYGADDPCAENLPPDRLIAWERDAEFAVLASPRVADLYLSGVQVRPTAPTSLLLSGDLRRTAPGRRLWRWLTRLYVPW